jgi:ribosome biogenesis GTPase A
MDVQAQKQMIFALRTDKITLMFINAMNSGTPIGALRLGIEPYETQTSIMIRDSPGYVYNSSVDLIDVKVEKVWARLSAPNSIPKDWGVIDPVVDVVQISFLHSKQNAYGDLNLGDNPDALDTDR